MKTKTIATFFLSILMRVCLAQNADSTATTWQIAALLVPQYTQYHNASDIADKKYEAVPSFGLTFGVQAVRFLPKGWAVAADILYAQQGQNYEPNVERAQSTATYQRSFDYLKIPVFIQKNWKIRNFTSFYAALGLQTDVLLRASYSKEARILKNANFNGTNEYSIYKPINISAAAKIGFAFYANKNLAVLLQIRADASLLNPDNTQNAYWTTAAGSINKTDLPTNTRSESTLRTVSVGVGLAYGF
jgi:Outer membrane protein beta-barrel domain